MQYTTAKNWINERMRASQNKKELTVLYGYLKNINPKIVLEIGCHQGYSLEAWNVLFPDALILGIELHPEGLDQTVCCRGDIPIRVLGGDSHDEQSLVEIVKYLEGEPVDFLFLDGDHTYDSVKQDYLMYSPLVREGGIIAFHDAALEDNPLVDVHKFFEEIRSDKDWTITIGRDGEGDQLQQTGTGTGILFV